MLFALKSIISRKGRRVIAVSLAGLLSMAGVLTTQGGQRAQAKPKSTAAAQKSVQKSKAPSRVASPPEAGVKLLLGILQRIGGEPQIALQQPAQQAPADNLIANSIFNQNTVKPELAIRPQSKSKTLTRARFAYAPNRYVSEDERSSVAADDKADANPSKARTSSIDGKQIASNYNQSMGGFAQAGAPASSRGLSEESQRRLGGSLKKLYDLSDALSGVQQWRQSAELSRGEAKGLSSNIKEYGNEVIKTNAPSAASFAGRARRSMEVAAESEPSADRDAASMKLENPGAFRTMREYRTDKGSIASRKAADKSAHKHIAYLPPSLVAGVPGLHLGSSKAQALSFMSSRGDVTHKTVGDWTVWTLTDRKSHNMTMQVYVRQGTVEAFRIFDRSFVPSRLGINLASNLKDMKTKFGEPAFILEEPSITSGAKTRGVKNYVYPVSQICFQLSRPAPEKEPEIQSVLLFKFL